MISPKTFFRIFIFLIGSTYMTSCDDDQDLDGVGTAEATFSDETYRIAESTPNAIKIPVNVLSPYHSGGSVSISVDGGIYGEDYTTDRDTTDFDLEFSKNSTLE